MISASAFIRFWLLVGITVFYIFAVDSAYEENNEKEQGHEQSHGNPFFEVCINQ
jgi:hypothetical protein